LSDPEALALIEFGSIAVGTRAVDALIKRAPVKLERVGTLQPGKLAVLFSGDVASVDESFEEALRVAATSVDDQMMLPHVHPSVYRVTLGLPGESAASGWSGDTLGVIETATMAATIEATDAAVKGASVRVVQIRLGDELGGKGLAHLIGEQHDVEAAIDIAVARLASSGRAMQSSITPRIDTTLIEQLAHSTRFWEAKH